MEQRGPELRAVERKEGRYPTLNTTPVLARTLALCQLTPGSRNSQKHSSKYLYQNSAPRLSHSNEPEHRGRKGDFNMVQWATTLARFSQPGLRVLPADQQSPWDAPLSNGMEEGSRGDIRRHTLHIPSTGSSSQGQPSQALPTCSLPGKRITSNP